MGHVAAALLAEESLAQRDGGNLASVKLDVYSLALGERSDEDLLQKEIVNVVRFLFVTLEFLEKHLEMLAAPVVPALGRDPRDLVLAVKFDGRTISYCVGGDPSDFF